MEIILMVGIAGSGKSTMARKIFSQHVRVSLDDIRQWSRGRRKKTLCRYAGSRDGALSEGRKIEHVLVAEALDRGQNVVVDDTDLTRKIRRRHVDLGRKYGATINVVFFQNFLRAYAQNRRRPNALPDGVLDSHQKELELPHEDEGFGYVQIVK